MNGDCPVWSEESLISRLQKCRRMLYFHNMIPAGEDEKVRKRLAKLKESENGKV